MLFVLTQSGALALLGAVFGATGSVLLDRLRLPVHRTLGPTLSSLGLGLAAWQWLLLGVAGVQLYRPWAIAALGAACLLGGAWIGVRARTSGRLLLRPARPSRVQLASLLVPAAILLACFAGALSPDVGWDDAVYHLTLPRRYIERGGFERVPFSIYSHWPHGVELLYGLGLMLQDQVLPKLMHTGYLLAVCVAVYRIARQHTTHGLGVTAVLLVLCNGVVLFEASVAYIDIAFAFYLLMAVAYAQCYLERGERKAALVAGIYCGAVAASKLSGLAALACVAPVVLVLRARREKRGTTGVRAGLMRAVEAGLLLSVPTALFALPWYAKAYLATGNPLYPMFYEVFGGAEWSTELGHRFFGWQAAIGMGREPTDYLGLPWRMVVNADWDYAHFAGTLGLGWLVAWPCGLFALVRVSAARLYMGTAVLYSMFWAASSQQMRFMIPALPLFALGAALGVHELLGRLRAERIGRSLAIGACGLIVATSAPALGATLQMAGAQALHLARGVRPSPVPPGHRYVNEETPISSRVMLLNRNDTFFLERDCIADSVFEASQMSWLLGHARSEREGAALLASHKITHLYVAGRDWGIRYPAWLARFLRNERYSQLAYTCLQSRCRIYRLVR